MRLGSECHVSSWRGMGTAAGQDVSSCWEDARSPKKGGLRKSLAMSSFGREIGFSTEDGTEMLITMNYIHMYIS